MSQTLPTDRAASPARRAVARFATEVLAPWVWMLGMVLGGVTCLLLEAALR